MMSISILTGSSSASIFGPITRNPVPVSAAWRAGSPWAWDQVAGDLLAEEAVVGRIGVERGHDVVAVPPGVGVGDVLVHAVGVGVAGQVEPAAPPAFAIGGAGQEPVDEAG